MPLPIDWALATWCSYNEKFGVLTGVDLRNLATHFNSEEERKQISEENMIAREKAATSITKWWKKHRNSGTSIPVNPNGLHSQAFRTFLNGKQIKKRLSFDADQALLHDIEQGNLNSPRFKDQNVLSNLINLFASGKITWLQKATLSSVVETQNSFGVFEAYPIVNENGDFTEKARNTLLPFLHKGFSGLQNNDLSDEQRDQFLALINTLPPSERYFFIFPQQKLDTNGSFPSEHNPLREEGSNLVEDNIGHRLLNVKKKEKEYQGILKLSFGAQNALGLASYGVKNWFALIPILGHPSINNVDFLGHLCARPMIASESIYLGILKRVPKTHGLLCDLADAEAHDLYHQYKCSQLGNQVHQGVERLIQLTRQTLGIMWSIDLWLLRDFNLDFFNSGETTSAFINALKTSYRMGDLANCTAQIQHDYCNRVMMFTPYKNGVMHSNFPAHIVMILAIDLVKNTDIWRTYGIDIEKFSSEYSGLLKMAKYLYQQNLLTDDMKANVLKIEAFIRAQFPIRPETLSDLDADTDYLSSWEMPRRVQAETLFKQVEAELSTYEAHRDNSCLFLGFTKRESAKSRREEGAEPAHNQQSLKKNKIG